MSFRVLGEAYANAPAISVDYAIAEKTSKLRCLPLDTAWSDVGSWAALWTYLEKSDEGNVVHGHGDIMLENVRNRCAQGPQGESIITVLARASQIRITARTWPNLRA